MTTVTISGETHRKLKELKKEREADSFNELLEEIADKELEVPDSMFGAVKGMKKGDIRDRNDRIDRYD